MITQEQLNTVNDIAQYFREKKRMLAVCGFTAIQIKQTLGWQAVVGRYIGLDCEYVANYPDDSVQHAWNILPDGTIIDATANQFNKNEEMPRIIPSSDPRQAWYIEGRNLYKKLEIACPELEGICRDLPVDTRSKGR